MAAVHHQNRSPGGAPGSDSLTREQLAELPREGSLPVALLWLGVAMIVMPMATRMVVDNSTVLANYFAISELTVGLTVVAIGTSLPELATAIAGARKGEDDIAIGNIIGANILHIALVLGLPALIAPGSFCDRSLHSRLWRDAAGQPDLRSAVLAPSAASRDDWLARCWSAALWFGWRCCFGQHRSSLNDSG